MEETAAELVDKLIKALDGTRPTRSLERLKAGLMPSKRPAHELKLLEEILSKIPGHSVEARAKKIGVSRWTYYRWLDGVNKPTVPHATKIARLTGHTVKEIMGA